MSVLAFSLFADMVQDGELGEGIGLLLTFGSGAIAALLWACGVLWSLAKPARHTLSPGLPGFLIAVGGLVLLPGLIGLAYRYGSGAFDPYAHLRFNWPYLSWLASFGGGLTLVGGLAALGKDYSSPG